MLAVGVPISAPSSTEKEAGNMVIPIDASGERKPVRAHNLMRVGKPERPHANSASIDASGQVLLVDSSADSQNSATSAPRQVNVDADLVSRPFINTTSELMEDSSLKGLKRDFDYIRHSFQHLRTSLSDSAGRATVEFLHGGRSYQYRLSSFSVYTDDAMVTEYTDHGEVPLSKAGAGTFRSEESGKTAFAVITNNNSVSGLFEVEGGALVEVMPSNEANGTGGVLLQGGHSLHRISLIHPASLLFGGVKTPQEPESDGKEIEHNVPHDHGSAKWFPGCYPGDSAMHELTLGIICDKFLYDRPGYGSQTQKHVETAIAKTSFIHEKMLNIRLKVNYMKVYSTSSAPNWVATDPQWTTPLSNRLYNLREAIEDNKIPLSAITHILTADTKSEVQGYGFLGGLCDFPFNRGADCFWDVNDGFSTIRHEIGHNYGGRHCIEPPFKSGLMCANSYGPYNKENICNVLKQRVNNCKGHFKTAAPPPPPPFSCFPADSTVVTPDGDQIRLHDLVRGQFIATADAATHQIGFEKFLGDLHSDAEHSQPSEFVNLIHEHGSLSLSASHFVNTFESGFVPADQVNVGEHLLTNFHQGRRLQRSRVLSIKTVVEVGIYAPLTFSGNILVNGVLVSSYTIDELRKFAKPYTQQRMIELIGYSGWNSVMHVLAFPLRISFHIGLPDLIERALSWGLPGSSLLSRFLLPDNGDAVGSKASDDLPAYVEFAGRTFGFVFDTALSRL